MFFKEPIERSIIPGAIRQRVRAALLPSLQAAGLF
jgi:hypothetical protein